MYTHTHTHTHTHTRAYTYTYTSIGLLSQEPEEPHPEYTSSDLAPCTSHFTAHVTLTGLTLLHTLLHTSPGPGLHII
jgi:hypothetical protein